MASVIKSVKGLDKVKKSLNEIKNPEAVKQALLAGGYMLEKTAKESIAHGSPSGRMYGNHRASAPGEPPASDTGALLSSIHTRQEDDGLTVVVGSNAPHASHTEYGTKNMAARPWLQPAFEINRKNIVARLKRALQIKRK